MGDAAANGTVQIQVPCTFAASTLQMQQLSSPAGPVSPVYHVIAHAHFAVCKGLAS